MQAFGSRQKKTYSMSSQVLDTPGAASIIESRKQKAESRKQKAGSRKQKGRTMPAA